MYRETGIKYFCHALIRACYTRCGLVVYRSLTRKVLTPAAWQLANLLCTQASSVQPPESQTVSSNLPSVGHWVKEWLIVGWMGALVAVW